MAKVENRMAGAVINQPQIMPAPQQIPGVPPGLEYLTQLDQLLIKQEMQLMEVLANWECKNKYRIFNTMNQQVFYAFEESELCNRLMCGPGRGFRIHITDNTQQEVLMVDRPFLCCKGGNTCCCAEGSCQYPMYVKDRMGNPLGTLLQLNSCSCAYNHFCVQDNSGQMIFEIMGPCCPCQGPCCKADVNYKVTDPKSSTQVSNIAKQWAGWQELFTDSDHYCVTFPIDMDVNHKALMLASVFMVDFMVFEQQKNNN